MNNLSINKFDAICSSVDNGIILLNKNLEVLFWNKWLEIRKGIMDEHGKEHDFIFITKDGDPASADRLRDWMSRWSDVVGQPCYPHNFRHYNVSFLKRLELEDDFIVYLTGWSESTGHSMVAIYNDMTAKDRKWKNLDKTNINFTIRKTGSQISIRVPDRAMEIIKKYKVYKKNVLKLNLKFYCIAERVILNL